MCRSFIGSNLVGDGLDESIEVSRRSRNFQVYVKADLYSYYEGVIYIYSTMRHNPGTYGPVRNGEKVSLPMCERGQVAFPRN